MENALLLRASHISKSFELVHALTDVSFELHKGEVHCLMGENGAGKSTLGKIIAGIQPADSGAIEFEGKQVKIQTPSDAIKLGISIVMQEFNSMPHLPVYENIFLGHHELYKGGFLLDKPQAVRRTKELLAMFGMENQISPLSRLRDLSVAEQQIVEIVKAVSYDSRVIILDEPTASLTSKETDRLFMVVRQLKEKGVGFIIASHRFNEVFEISDKITVLRDGLCVMNNVDMKDMDEQKLVRAMVGREITDFFGEKRALARGVEKKPMLRVEHLTDSWQFIKDLSFEAMSGEILGIAGLVGAGRTTLVRSIFGADARASGRVLVDGRELVAHSPGDAIKKGLSLVTENRKEEGLFVDLSICLNTAFPKTANRRAPVLPIRQEQADCLEMIKRLNIKIGHYQHPAKSLSGGNQQKVVLAKWLLTGPKVLLLDEPTRGIDISAKAEIYNIIRELVSNGLCVVVVSSELPEILGICDRVLVMRDGSIVGDMRIGDASEEKIMSCASFGAATQNEAV